VRVARRGGSPERRRTTARRGQLGTMRHVAWGGAAAHGAWPGVQPGAQLITVPVHDCPRRAVPGPARSPGACPGAACVPVAGVAQPGQCARRGPARASPASLRLAHACPSSQPPSPQHDCPCPSAALVWVSALDSLSFFVYPDIVVYPSRRPRVARLSQHMLFARTVRVVRMCRRAPSRAPFHAHGAPRFSVSRALSCGNKLFRLESLTLINLRN
jgi:hypothetical protein